MEHTLVLVKPDGVHKSLIGDVIARIEKIGLTLVGIKMLNLPLDLLKEHYAHLTDKPFFPDIVKFMQASPVVAMVWEGTGAVQKVRDLAGPTDSAKASPGTIRGDLGVNIQYNVVHASDSPEAAEAEVARFFTTSELIRYDKAPSQFN